MATRAIVDGAQEVVSAVSTGSLNRCRLAQVIKLDHDFGTAVSGVLTDGHARVLALWGSYSEQVPCYFCLVSYMRWSLPVA